jgi:hypothetical protein
LADWKSHKGLCKGIIAAKAAQEQASGVGAAAEASTDPADILKDMAALRETLGVRYDTSSWAKLSTACGSKTWTCAKCKVENVSLQDSCVVCGGPKSVAVKVKGKKGKSKSHPAPAV